MENQEIILELMEMQTAFNNKTNGECWVEGITKEGREIDWFRCIRQEAMELVDCFPWKHWKSLDQKLDVGNAKIEIVDLLHFILSQVVTFGHEGNMPNESLAMVWGDSAYKTEFSDIMVVEDLVRATYTLDISLCLDIFNVICERFGMDLAELKTLYLAKNVLNTFRQQNGYKEGTYVKMWVMPNGIREDNDVLRELIENSPGLNYEDLLQAVGMEYAMMIDRKGKVDERTKDTETN